METWPAKKEHAPARELLLGTGLEQAKPVVSNSASEPARNYLKKKKGGDPLDSRSTAAGFTGTFSLGQSIQKRGQFAHEGRAVWRTGSKRIREASDCGCNRDCSVWTQFFSPSEGEEVGGIGVKGCEGGTLASSADGV